MRAAAKGRAGGVLLASCLIAILMASVARVAEAAERPVPMPARRSLIHEPAPTFTRRDLEGHALNLAGFRGKVVLLDFWATWCAPCQVELPRFAEWQRQFGARGFQVVAISMDDDPVLVRRLARRLKLNFPVAMGDAKLGERYGGVLGLPLTYLIDRNGIVQARFQGETDPKAIEKRLKTLLGEAN